MQTNTDSLHISRIATGMLIFVSVIHTLLYFLIINGQIDINARMLVVSFWLIIFFLTSSFVWIKKDTKLIIVSSFVCILILIPTAESCMTWTAWSINGFAP